MKLSDRADEILQVLAETDAGTEIYALYDEILAALRLAETIPAIRAQERERAAKVATGFLVGDPQAGIPLRNPMGHEIADAIRALKDEE